MQIEGAGLFQYRLVAGGGPEPEPVTGAGTTLASGAGQGPSAAAQQCALRASAHGSPVVFEGSGPHRAAIALLGGCGTRPAGCVWGSPGCRNCCSRRGIALDGAIEGIALVFGSALGLAITAPIEGEATRERGALVLRQPPDHLAILPQVDMGIPAAQVLPGSS